MADEKKLNALAYPASRLAPRFDLVDVAREIQAADETMATVASAKLASILEQVRMLKEEAAKILDETRASQALHRAACNFKKVPGRVYHLYRKPDGGLYFSMLSPEDWNGKPPHEFAGSHRLEVDMTWSPADRARPATQDEAARAVAKLLADGKLLGE